MITAEIPIKDPKNPPVVRFPDRCVNCGKPEHVVLPLKLAIGVEKRGEGVLMHLPVPVCEECERKEKRIFAVTAGPFVIGGLLICVLVFIPVWWITPQGPTLQTQEFDIVLGAFVGMIAGLIGGSVVEFAMKFLFAPVFGRLLVKRPLSVLSFLNDSEEVIGLSAKFTDKKKSLKLTFENDEIAKEFKSLNS